jgi:hypothetical protein
MAAPSPGAADRVRHQLRAAAFKTHGKDLYSLLERYDTRGDGTLFAQQIEDGVVELLPGAVPPNDMRALFDAVRGQELDYRRFLDFTPVQQYVPPADINERPTAASRAATASSPGTLPRAPAAVALPPSPCNAAASTAPCTTPAMVPGGAAQAHGHPVRIMHLCERDKSKVAKLIQQLVKSGSECERLEAQLKAEREAHAERFAKLREQNTKLAAEVAAGRTKLRKSLTMLRAYQERLLALQTELEATSHTASGRTAESGSQPGSDSIVEAEPATAISVERLLQEIQALRDEQRALQQVTREQAARGMAHEAAQKLQESRARDVFEAERLRLEQEMHAQLDRERETLQRQAREQALREFEGAKRDSSAAHALAGSAEAPAEQLPRGRVQREDKVAPSGGNDANTDDAVREKRQLLKELSRLRAELKSKTASGSLAGPSPNHPNGSGNGEAVEETGMGLAVTAAAAEAGPIAAREDPCYDAPDSHVEPAEQAADSRCVAMPIAVLM